ncbi:MAG: formimidoylglutamate deiminase [Alphaproteobacteria bacterium]|nr:formimidoylglutamate deiminase [Alphaproteobacteria bacterium]
MSREAPRRLLAPIALLPDGWHADVGLDLDDDGTLTAATPGAAAFGRERLDGPVLPGLPNLHSHAFQRAMAGLAEHRDDDPEDDFWSWRRLMYGLAATLQPDEVEAIAAQLYVEMLEAGYTAVAEFHYLHHQPDGRPYDDPAELSERVIAAARQAGIGITHLPVLYMTGGFGGKAPTEGQRRFLNPPDRFLKLVDRVRTRHRGDAEVAVGIAPHSLRAVPPEALAEVAGAVDPTTPVHLHIAEQTGEVEQCLAWSGQRPVEWLLAHAPVDRRWCLVHATHLTPEEVGRAAASGATAGLCPTTEANLGDGFFPAEDWIAAGGAIGIGSDSHISVSGIEELRWLEYGRRLLARRRNRLTTRTGAHDLFQAALSGGARACGRAIGRIVTGARADLVILDGESPALAEVPAGQLLDALVFAGNANPVKHVMVGGRWRVRDGRHLDRDAVRARYRRSVAAVRGRL